MAGWIKKQFKSKILRKSDSPRDHRNRNPFPEIDRRFREIDRRFRELCFAEKELSELQREMSEHQRRVLERDSPDLEREFSELQIEFSELQRRVLERRVLEILKDDISEIRDKDKLHKDDRHVPDVFTTNPYYLKLYNEAISKGEEKDSTIRINVVGNFGQGKTTLTKRLLQETTQGVESTNSVEINHCQYEYIQEEIAFSTTEKLEDEDDIIGRIAFVAHSKMMTDGQDESINTHKSFEKQPTSMSLDLEKFETISEETNNKEQLESISEEPKNSKHQLKTISEQTYDMVKTGDQSLTSPKLRQEPSRIEKSSISLSERKKFTLLLQNSQNKDVPRRDLEIWDFGGQFSFYATHNLFHSRRAVYLLVFDLSKPLTSIVKDHEFPDKDEEKTMEQYAKFWINSIHSYAGSEKGKEPPVILVGTHKDKLKGDEQAKQVFIEEYFEQIRKLFENTNMINHIQRKDFAVDNTNSNDKGFIELRKEIIRQGRNHAEISIPAKWIPLERAVRRHRHEKIISFQKLMSLDSGNEFPLKDEEQVKLFLRYHHSKGTLLYYDEEQISAYVVLDAQYLIDAFKCIITSRRFCRNDHNCRKLWIKLTTEARLENGLIKTLWGMDIEKDFLKHNKELLMFLEKHLILSEAMDYSEETQNPIGLGWYIVPSLLRMNSTEAILTEVLSGTKQTSVRFVMSFYQSPLVQIVFYRLLSALIGKWPVFQISSPKRRTFIYENLGVFQINEKHVGIAAYKENDIELWVVSLCSNLNVASECADKFRRFSEMVLKKEFVKCRHSRSQKENPYMTCIKCNDKSHGPGGGSEKIELNNMRCNNQSRRRCPDGLPHEIYSYQILFEWFLEDKIKVSFPNRQFSYKELSDVSSAIGKNWEFLGLKLGLQVTEIQQINLDETTFEMKIFSMLLKWDAEKEDEATMFALIQALETERRVEVEWDDIRNIIDKINSECLEN